MNNSPLAVLAAIVSLIALLAGLAGQAAVLGMAAVVLIAVLCALGLRAAGRPTRRTYAFLVAFATVFCALLALGFHLHDPNGTLVTIGGFPVGTAMLIYGIAPLGITMGVLYALVFDTEILPEDKHRDFIDRFAKK